VTYVHSKFIIAVNNKVENKKYYILAMFWCGFFSVA